VGERSAAKPVASTEPAEGTTGAASPEDATSATSAEGATGAGPAEGVSAAAATDDGLDARADESAAAPAEPETIEEVEEFKAGAFGDKLFEALAPLRAKRELEETDTEELEQFGLVEPEGVLTVERKDKDPRVFELGASVYGGGSRYMRDRQSGAVYLIEAQAFKPLKRGGRALQDRRLRPGKTEDVVAVKIAGEAGTVELEQHNRDDRDKAFWAFRGQQAPNDTAKNWLDKVFRMRSRGFVQDDEQPARLVSSFRIDITDDDGKTVVVEFLRTEPDAETEEWFVRSDYTRGLVRVAKTLAAEAAADIEAVVNEADG
jgi:hypothetical protein